MIGAEKIDEWQGVSIYRKDGKIYIAVAGGLMHVPAIQVFLCGKIKYYYER